jgi:hypothetical protein
MTLTVPAPTLVRQPDHHRTAQAASWDRLRPRLTRRTCWIDHHSDLPVIEGTLIPPAGRAPPEIVNSIAVPTGHGFAGSAPIAEDPYDAAVCTDQLIEQCVGGVEANVEQAAHQAIVD